MSGAAGEKGKSVLRNVVYGFSTWILPLGLSFLATPIIYRALGDADYGIYALVLGFIAYSFNFNVGRAITKYVAEFRASGETEKIREVFSATLYVNLAVGLGGLVVILSAARTLVADVLQIPAEAQAKTVTALQTAALTIFCLMLNQVFSAVLQGIQRFDLFAKLNNLNNIVLIAGNLLLALGGFGLVGLLVWNLGVTAFAALASGWLARRHLAEFSLRVRFGREALRMVFGYSAWVIVYQFLANFLLLFERGWITSRLGPESLSHYVVPMTVAIYIHAFISSLMMVVFPLASELQNEPERLRRLYRKATKIVVFLTVFLGASLIAQSRPFLTVWMGADFADKSSALLVVHTVTFALLAVNIVSWQMAEGLGRPHYNAVLFMVCFSVTVSGMIGLTDAYGNFGAAVARLSGFGTMFVGIFVIEKMFFGRVQIGFWLRLAGIVAVAAAAAVGVEVLFTRQFGASWPALAAGGAAGGAVYCGAAWLLGFVTADERALIARLLGRKMENGQEI